jgi:hypothetical protein
MEAEMEMRTALHYVFILAENISDNVQPRKSKDAPISLMA